MVTCAALTSLGLPGPIAARLQHIRTSTYEWIAHQKPRAPLSECLERETRDFPFRPSLTPNKNVPFAAY
jgi:hypothetical protein